MALPRKHAKRLPIQIGLLASLVCGIGSVSGAFAQSPHNRKNSTTGSTLGSGFAPCAQGIPQTETIKGITQEQAIAVARRHLLSRDKSLNQFRVVPCELTIFWRIIFDRGGPEYVVDKRSGAIRRTQVIPEDWAQPGAASSQSIITRDMAIEIARKDAIESVPNEASNHFIIFACELERVWRVFVEFKLVYAPNGDAPILPYSSTPNYVIDKSTGKILFKQRYGSQSLKQLAVSFE